MVQKGKKKVVIKELAAKVKIIRQIPKEEHQSQRPSGLERREEEVEREIISMPSGTSPMMIRPSPVQPQASPRAGNTALQQNPQEDSQEVKRWYAQTAVQAGRKYQAQNTAATVIPQDITFGRNPLNRGQDIQGIRGQSMNDEKNYDLSKSPEKRDSRRRYPWEV
ncbi:hypothetical protein FJZ18_00585 [Candidatus Pacearchaeota archaeon]|nr:hypothetical protein [Candidatus Pacearchaeota archaeon]